MKSKPCLTGYACSLLDLGEGAMGEVGGGTGPPCYVHRDADSPEMLECEHGFELKVLGDGCITVRVEGRKSHCGWDKRYLAGY